MASQKTLHRQVLNLHKTITDMGNPFLNHFKELVTLNSRACVNEAVITSLYSFDKEGRQQYQLYVKNVLDGRTHSINEPIKRNKLTFFKYKILTTKPKLATKLKAAQFNSALFGQLFVATQQRESDVNAFFGHEMQKFPPSLSDHEKLYFGNKSDLIDCITQHTDAKLSVEPNEYDCIVLDGAAVVHFLSTGTAKTFEEYFKTVFLPYLLTQLKKCKRLDIVWDTYISNSIKESAREKRGVGTRLKVSATAKVPSKWSDFLKDPLNKKELFDYLTSQVSNCTFHQDKQVFITAGKIPFISYIIIIPQIVTCHMSITGKR